MLNHHCAPRATEEDKEKFFTLINDKPWLIPSTVLLEIIPVSIIAYGFWKNCRLKKRLQIEHQKTVREYIKKSETGKLTQEEFYYLKHI
ncbi:hypothetical protein [Companilactobacillus nodensis]|uniref:Transposase n=1 Tax=Companilactobacillus nodensis DSM 19682 = JCM 14932 = NBRC 107160 TaxID=1423775 RepID=A0A0R1K7W5_9LACO|nr:hypothetical protein [Companilactobacillus nodensis]KRK79532.1 hypothetical protein FD03_GL000667 [Companilactobacillus nodensis DSM 19682 = JCM 14932 = NBRC 107160]